MIDCFSRRLVGWSVADHMRTSLVEDALKAAATTRGSSTNGLAGAIFHSDHGSVYTSKDYAKLCADLGVTQSMGAVGTSADNALAESVIGLFKTEVIRPKGPWRTLEAVEFATLEWVDWFNTRRLLGPIGYMPPAEYEAHYYEQAAVA